MSANINLTNVEQKKKILMVVANPSTSATTGWPVGFWWAELTHPYWAFTEAGYEVEVRSPQGGALQADRCVLDHTGGVVEVLDGQGRSVMALRPFPARKRSGNCRRMNPPTSLNSPAQMIRICARKSSA